ncbi:MAG TPA: peptidyl-prolyl cis-trans isomerase [Pyrinomonadaceae bacterium]|nr:peptidyl-prolyl cis-trans isomerase [Pyrinomonadaceae bacterium]
MLKQLSKLERTRGVIIIGFAVLMAVSLIIFYAPGRNSSNIDPSKNTAVLAKVGSTEITVADVARVKDQYRQMFGGRVSLAQLGGNQRLLDGLINKHVVAQEAERLGLGASDGELAEKIRKQFSDASGQFVGFDRYKESITSRYGDVEKFENDLRADIASEKLRAFVSASVNVSDDEIQQEYKRKNTSFIVNYVVVSTDKLAEKIQPSDADLRAYYEAHKTDLRYLEPQKKIRYVFIDTDKIGAKLQISDKELKDEYDKLQPEFKQAGVKVQQILLKVARKDLDQQVEQKAKDLITKLRGSSGQATEAAFAEAARGNSEDPVSAKNGGFLDRPVKRNPNKPHGLYDRTLDMQPGDVSDIPIKYAGNWYILRRGDAVPKTFEEAKPELLVSLRNRKGYEAAFKVAVKAQARLKETKDPQKVAQEFAAEVNNNAADMVRETPFIKPDDDVPGIGSNQQFESAIASLENPNDVGESTGVKGGFAIPMLTEKKEPRIPEFDEVKTKIVDTVKQTRAKEQVEQKAKDLLASITSPDALKAAGEKEGFEADEQENFKLGSTLGKAGASAVLDDLIYGMKAGELSKNPVKVDDKWVVVGITKRTEADLAAFAKERDTLKTSMISERQSQVFEDYVSSVQEKMKRDGKIKIYQDVLDALPEEEEPALPGGINFPTGG